jgi:hypothetical protein
MRQLFSLIFHFLLFSFSSLPSFFLSLSAYLSLSVSCTSTHMHMHTTVSIGSPPSCHCLSVSHILTVASTDEKRLSVHRSVSVSLFPLNVLCLPLSHTHACTFAHTHSCTRMQAHPCTHSHTLMQVTQAH